MEKTSMTPSQAYSPLEKSSNPTAEALKRFREEIMLQPPNVPVSIPRDILALLLTSAINSERMIEEAELLKSSVKTLRINDRQLFQDMETMCINTGATFFRFGRLPVEIRTEVWKAFTRLPRIINLPYAELHNDLFRFPLPGAYYVCRESRQQAPKSSQHIKQHGVNIGYWTYHDLVTRSNVIPYFTDDFKSYCVGHSRYLFLDILGELLPWSGHICLSIESWHSLMKALDLNEVIHSISVSGTSKITLVIGRELPGTSQSLELKAPTIAVEPVFAESLQLARIVAKKNNTVVLQEGTLSVTTSIASLWTQMWELGVESYQEARQGYLAEGYTDEEFEMVVSGGEDRSFHDCQFWTIPKFECMQFA